MRRVYYSFMLSFFEQPLLWVGLVLGGSVALFGRLTHVAAIWHNFVKVPVGSVPGYIEQTFAGALSRGEFDTVLVVLAMAILTTVAVYQLARVRFVPRWQMV